MNEWKVEGEEDRERREAGRASGTERRSPCFPTTPLSCLFAHPTDSPRSLESAHHSLLCFLHYDTILFKSLQATLAELK